MGDLVERVAKAIAGESDRLFYFDDPMGGHGPGQCENCDGNRKRYLDQARAAIAAMREPTEAMDIAGQAKCDSDFTVCETVWQAMIDEALK